MTKIGAHKGRSTRIRVKGEGRSMQKDFQR